MLFFFSTVLVFLSYKHFQNLRLFKNLGKFFIGVIFKIRINLQFSSNFFFFIIFGNKVNSEIVFKSLRFEIFKPRLLWFIQAAYYLIWSLYVELNTNNLQLLLVKGFKMLGCLLGRSLIDNGISLFVVKIKLLESEVHLN